MLIAELDIKNFRGIRAGRVRFGTFTVIIGANNSGKTTITEALALLFGRDRLVRTLTGARLFWLRSGTAGSHQNCSHDHRIRAE